MGFFSQLCDGCEHPILSGYATSKVNKWMEQAVAITPEGDVITGTYDGYGRLDSTEDAVGWENTVYHLACWKKAGQPMEWTGASDHAPDQGYFFDAGEHDMPEPEVE